MRREEALSILRAHFSELAEHYGVKNLSIFGSVARDEADPDSDVDVLVEFAGAPTFDRFMDLKFRLEELMGTRVDLVTVHAVRTGMRPYVDREAIRVA